MKKFRFILAAGALLAGLCSNAAAGDLLDVKPVSAGNAVAVEISANIPMTYTYYTIPGQARAVVDIANADPENVEPLIVVNQGNISSISVDKAQISDMVVSRIVFNLESRSEIAVAASADRKKLSVTFGGTSKSTTEQTSKALPAAQATLTEEPAAALEQTAALPVAKPTDTPPVDVSGLNEEDPFGLDEPPAASKTASTPAAAPAPVPPASAAKPEPSAADVSAGSPVFIKAIRAGNDYIEIATSSVVGTYKVIKLSQPERLAIDIPTAKSALETKTVPINKFGITKARIGLYPDYIRIVLDTSKADFPGYTIARSRDGLRITFK